MRKIFKYILAIILSIALYVIICILWGQITYYHPPKVEVIAENPKAPLMDSMNINMMIYNIGYAGLGAKSDFFYDGGKMMRASEEDTKTYLRGILDQISGQKLTFTLLQEVDSNSKRSYDIYETEAIRQKQSLSQPYSYFGTNYKVNYIPLPWTEPMGHVNSGLMTLSSFEPYRVERHQLPGNFSFPKRLFFLRRCLLVNYYKLKNGNELVLINIHNSAYDDDGKLKRQEMDYLKNFIATQKGKYIVCGGDWNQCPPNFPYNKLGKNKEGDYFQTNVDANLGIPGNWVYDSTMPTNRKNNKPYTDSTFVTVIDFVWLSDNIQPISCRGVDNQFAYSDHQPVVINFILK